MDQPSPEIPEAPKDSMTIEQPTIRRNASWGAIISIVIILLMVVVGAFYAWGQRLAELRAARAAQQPQSVSF